jgi:hypothetical protein
MAAIVPKEIRNSRFRRNRAAANSLRVQTDARDPESGPNKSHLIGSGTAEFLNPFINGPRPSRESSRTGPYDNGEVGQNLAIAEK